MLMQDVAYSLAFFFGPGFPLSFGVVSVPEPAPLFVPGFGPGIPFLFDSSLPFCEESAAPGAGVLFDSDAFSVDDVEATRGAGVEVDDDEDFALDSFRVAGLDEKRMSKLGESRNLTILLVFEVFEVFDDRSPADDDGVAGVEFLVVMVVDYWWAMRAFVVVGKRLGSGRSGERLG